MTSVLDAILRCPVCAEPLAAEGSAFRCARGHSFDIAREGYVNLSGSVRSGRGAQGDTRAMLLARRAFLEAGHYAPLAQLVAGMTGEALAGWPAQPGQVYGALDAGCGEGYYTGALASALATLPGHARLPLLGLDASKDAARLAARRYPQARFLVADLTARLPLGDGALAALTTIFAPRNAGEFARTLAPGALLLIVIPAPDHLAGARATLPLLGIEPEKEAHILAQFARDFALIERRTLSFGLTLDAAALAHLLTMTPSAWRLGAEGGHLEERVAEAVHAAPTPARVLASFVALAFRRREG